jgi:hypothetical protein
MRPGLGRSLRSLNPPRRLGGWGDPLGTISKWDPEVRKSPRSAHHA